MYKLISQGVTQKNADGSDATRGGIGRETSKDQEPQEEYDSSDEEVSSVLIQSATTVFELANSWCVKSDQ